MTRITLALFGLATLFGCGPRTRIIDSAKPGLTNCSLKDTIDEETGARIYRLSCKGQRDVSEIPVEIFEPEVIKLCPETHITGESEILLKLGAALFAVYDGGPNKVRLVELAPNEYVTTDGRQCYFTVTEEGEVSYE
jgi:hypothetical protein